MTALPRRSNSRTPTPTVTDTWTVESRAVWRRPWLARGAAVLMLLVAGMFQSWMHLDQVQMTYEVSREVNTLRELRTERDLLRAELAAKQSPPHVRAVAEELGLREPAWDELVMVDAR